MKTVSTILFNLPPFVKAIMVTGFFLLALACVYWLYYLTRVLFAYLRHRKTIPDKALLLIKQEGDMITINIHKNASLTGQKVAELIDATTSDSPLLEHQEQKNPSQGRQ